MIKQREIEATRVYYENLYAEEAILCNLGGSRSSKSHSIAQLMLHKFNSERGKVFLTARKTVPWLKLTIYKDVINMMKDWGWYDSFIHNKTERTVIYPSHNNLWVFTSVDDPEKIKSTEFNYIHIEEANEFSYDDFMMLKLRMSGKENPGERNQMYISLNPNEKYGWVNQELIIKPSDDVKLIKSNYKDCIDFLPESYVKRLERLEQEDPSYWKIYGLGQYADIKGKIYSLEMYEGEYPKCKETIYGLDFGFASPNVLVRLDVDLESMSIYLTPLIYKLEQTKSDLIKEMRELGLKKDDEIYCDSEDPATIEEIYKNGFNAKPSDKAVLNGIEFLQRFTLYSKKEYVVLNREMLGYKRKVDKEGNVREDPVKFNDHCPDAVRYAAYTHLRVRFLHEEAADVYYVGMKERAQKERQKRVEDKDEYGEAYHGGEDGFD